MYVLEVFTQVTINVESVIIRVDVQKIISNLRYEIMTSFIIKNILYSIIHQTTYLWTKYVGLSSSTLLWTSKYFYL